METPAITKDEFEKFVPVAKTPDNVIFDRCAKDFDYRFLMIQFSHLGHGIASTISSQTDELQTAVKRLMCVTAFLYRLDTNDIAITNTGFGVVNSQNVAPASQFRIDALRGELENDYDNACDLLVELLTHTDNWSSTNQAYRVISNFCYNKSLFSPFGSNSRPLSHDVYQKLKSSAEGFSAIVQKTISRSYYEDILDKIRRAQLTDSHDLLIYDKCCEMIRFAIDGERDVRHLQSDIIRILEENIDNYPIYAASKEYAARHVTPYENTSEDPTYIF
jgi:hypothetical protein